MEERPYRSLNEYYRAIQRDFRRFAPEDAAMTYSFKLR